MVIVDTTVWIDYLTGVRNAETDWLDRALDRQRLGLTDLILCEVLQGIRQRGYTVRKTIDCWIATFCIRERHSLLHRDRDFDPFESEMGLTVVRP